MDSIGTGTAFTVVSILLAALIWLIKEVRDQRHEHKKWRPRLLYGFLLLTTFFGWFLSIMIMPDLMDQLLVYPNFAIAMIFGLALLSAPILTFVPDWQLRSSTRFLVCHITFMAIVMLFCVLNAFIAGLICARLHFPIAVFVSVVIFAFGLFQPRYFRRHP